MKELTGEQKELLRNAILLQLNAATPLGCKKLFLQNGVKVAGFQMLTEDQFEAELRYLFSHGMQETQKREINRANPVYQITQKGVEWLDEQNLI